MERYTNSDSYWLHGEIPNSLGDLTKLEVLNLSHNRISGSVPAGLRHLPKLRQIKLNGNHLDGAIPPLLGVPLGNVPSPLEILDLSENLLSGTVPAALGRLARLETLNLGYNQLEGGIPSDLGNLSKLATLDLSNNRLSGDIPAELGDIASLNTLRLSGNPFGPDDCAPEKALDIANNDVDLPMCLSANTDRRALIAFYMGMNYGEGWTEKWDIIGTDMSSWHGVRLDGNGRVTRLILSNNFRGSITYNKGMANLGRLSELTHLQLSGNSIGGTIPRELGSLSKLVHLDLSGNKLSGTIPHELGSLSKLAYLDLSSNQLGGAIPSTLANIEGLRTLKLSGDQTRYDTSGCVPEELFAIDDGNPDNNPVGYNDLTNIHGLSSCAINEADKRVLEELYSFTNGDGWTKSSGWNAGGRSLGAWHGVTVATVATGKVIDRDDLDCTGRVIMINLSSNNLKGTIPASLGDLECLYHLNLSDNELSGLIPESLGKLKGLQGETFIYRDGKEYLRLSKCPYNGVLDENVLDLSYNDLTGAIPASLGNLRCLSKLDLSNNKTRHYTRLAIPPLHYVKGLEGQIPAKLANLSELTYLDLSGNKLTGGIEHVLPKSEPGENETPLELILKENAWVGEDAGHWNAFEHHVVGMAEGKFEGKLHGRLLSDSDGSLAMMAAKHSGSEVLVHFVKATAKAASGVGNAVTIYQSVQFIRTGGEQGAYPGQDWVKLFGMGVDALVATIENSKLADIVGYRSNEINYFSCVWDNATKSNAEIEAACGSPP